MGQKFHIISIFFPIFKDILKIETKICEHFQHKLLLSDPHPQREQTRYFLYILNTIIFIQIKIPEIKKPVLHNKLRVTC